MAATAKRQSPSPLYHTEQIHLARFGQTAQSADGAELVKAFEMVKPDEYDAILMDIQTPHMNGYEATKAIRGGRNPLGKAIPIIAMTANAFSDDIQNSIAAGMDAYISKPIDVAILEKTMRGFLTPPRIHSMRTNVCEKHS